MHSFAQIQRTLLKSAGVEVNQWRSEAAFYAGNALSHDDARRPRALGHLHLPPAADLGCLPSGGVLAAGDVGGAAGGRPRAAGPGRCVPAGRQATTPSRCIFTLGGFIVLLLLAQAVASRPDLIDGIGVQGAVLGQLAARQTRRHRRGHVAGTPPAAGVGQPEPPRPRRRVQLVAVQLDRRRGLSGVRRLRRRRQALAGRADGRLRGGAGGRVDPADAGRAAGRRGGAGARPGVQRHDAGRPRSLRC